jgi:hypothetical protein
VTSFQRSRPESLPDMPDVQFKPGMAQEMLRELAPLLAEDGVDIDNIEDIETLQRALDRAVERKNMQLFTPVGVTRDLAVGALRQVVDTMAAGKTTSAAQLLDQVQPESPDSTVATVSSCIGVCLGLLDDWLSGHSSDSPKALAENVRLPAGHWFGERAATDILALARKGRAFRSLDQLIIRHGGRHVLFGSALALTATVSSWSKLSDVPVRKLARQILR